MIFWKNHKVRTLIIVMLAMFETYSRFIMAILTETLIAAVE
jgi:ATP-binding cassette subfamily C (CFTR/MRP) protein 4